ncbi:heparinase II/III family protein [Acinetobacter thermotolerans]|uniref:heparinase II/III domain-containing protein n=1 Tax=Acinetobacter thermotolerans TaxID=3151487 RepID=UPI00325B39F0
MCRTWDLNLRNKNNSKLGEDIFRNNNIVFPSFGAVKEKVENLYSLDPFSNRTWRWHLHQLTHVHYLIAYCYHEAINKKDVGEAIFNYIEAWSKYKNSENSEQDHMVWHDHATALRLKNLVIAYSFLNKIELISFGEKKYELLVGLINEHINILRNESFYSKHTNHGFDQSLFLYHAVLEFENLLPSLNEVKKLAEKRILEEVEYAFCSDGGHKENSPAYLNFGIKQCLMVIEIAKNYNQNLDAELKRINEVLEKATKVLTYTVKPDGYLPLIGDTSTYKVVDLFRGVKNSNYHQFKYAISEGLKGVKPLANSLILEETGYAFYRSHWNVENFRDAVHLVFKASYHSDYHRHDDDLSLTLYAYGQDWLIDGGIYKYQKENLNRCYIRSHLSHNLLSPNNIKANRNYKNPHQVELNNLSKNSIDKFHVIGLTNMYDGFKVSREIEIDNGIIFISDTCENKLNNEFSATSRFFFPFSMSVFIEGSIVTVVGLHKKMILEFECEEDLSLSVDEAKYGSEKGWLSEKTGELMRTKMLEVSAKAKKNTVLNVLFKVYFV